ncbi:MAG: polymerase subunit sigma-70 [Herbinix sp.]|jgi:RNA polymerase sigma-70 factor (ECF subfamily)|nr:polymerase subunit sigma-70 [Herbinix sp.]
MNNKSLEKIYQQYSNEVYLYAFSLCKNYHEAQELVSDTFFKALVSLEKEDGEFKYWLLRVCKNSWLDGLKKKKYILDKPYDEALSLTGNDMVNLILKEEERRTLYEVIQYLPQTYKEIIILHYFCNLSLKEISEIMNITPGAGRMLISRARKCLKERLNKEDFI